MHTYERSVRVAAPFDVVWDFHSTESGLVDLTPDWMNMRVESVTGPDGEPNPDVLEAGSQLAASTRPFGVGPRQDWVSDITERDNSGDTAYFKDVMSEGPFPHWEHTHLFYDDGEETLVRDRVEYDLPVGPLNPVFGPFAIVGFEPMFYYRHRRTKALLEP